MDFRDQIKEVEKLQATFRGDVKQILISLEHVDPIIGENKTKDFVDCLLLEMEQDGISKASSETLKNTRFTYLISRMNADNDALAQIQSLIVTYKQDRVRIANS